MESTGYKRRNQWGEVWYRLRKNWVAIVSLAVVAAIVILSVFSSWIAPYDYAKQDLGAVFQMPGAEHWFGTDNLGRDIFSRVLVGGRVSLLVAVLALAIATVIGCFMGVTAGYFGGRTDMIIMKLNDILMSIPQFLLAVSISAALGSGIVNTALAVSISSIPRFARLMRAEVLTTKSKEFVEAARAFGAGNSRIILRHVIPNSMASTIINISMSIGSSILAISSLSFIGLGVQPPTPEWGSILANGRAYIRDFWPLATFPGIAIIITLIAFNLLGDGLRDAMDPKLKR